MLNLKSTRRLVFNVWWGHSWRFGASFRRFVVLLFSNVHQRASNNQYYLSFNQLQSNSNSYKKRTEYVWRKKIEKDHTQLLNHIHSQN